MNVTTKTTRSLRTVAAVVAVAVACSTGAYAAGAAITSSKQIKAGVVNTGDIKNGTVKVKDLNAKTVTAVKRLEGWKTADLTGSWTTFPGYNDPGFRVDAVNGVVYLRGAMNFGADTGAQKNAFELPAGYRPAKTVTLGVMSSNPFGDLAPVGAIEIQTDGDVLVYGPTDDRFVSLDGLSFSIG